ncbi:hypothetical protein Tco_0724503 [Tanacetum coccineum]
MAERGDGGVVMWLSDMGDVRGGGVSSGQWRDGGGWCSGGGSGVVVGSRMRGGDGKESLFEGGSIDQRWEALMELAEKVRWKSFPATAVVVGGGVGKWPDFLERSGRRGVVESVR